MILALNFFSIIDEKLVIIQDAAITGVLLQ